MTFDRIKRHLQFARHLRPRQVVMRIWLLGKRQIVVRAVRACPAMTAGKARRPPPPISGTPPLPIFPSRTHGSVVEGDRLEVCFLNQRRVLVLPVPWQDPGVSVSAHLWAMHLHYMEFLEDLPEDRFVAVVLDWIETNRPYTAAYWHASWNSYALSIRCVVWMQQIARRRDRLDQRAVDTIAASLAEQIRFLERNLETDILGNHLIKNTKALLWAGRFFTGDEAERWRRIGRRLLLRELGEQILADGMHYERSPSYHNQVFADLIECYAVAGEGSISDTLSEMLARMAQVTADLRHPDGLVPLFNDAGLSSAYSPADCLEAYRNATGREVAARRQVALPEAGYYGLHSERSFFVADCGPIAPDFLTAHGHGDILSFEWSVGGRRVVVDQGVFRYEEGPERTASRSTLSHNTVSVAGAEQCDFFGSFRCGRRARAEVREYRQTADGFTLTGTHTGFDHLPRTNHRANRGASHVRTFTVEPGRLIIEDRMTYPSGDHWARAAFLLHPDCVVEVEGRAATIRCGEVVVRAAFETEPMLEPAEWWPDLGVRQETTRLVLHFRGLDRHRTEFTTCS